MKSEKSVKSVAKVAKAKSSVQVELSAARAALKSQKVLVADLFAKVRAEKSGAAEAKVKSAAARKDAAIAKAKARLEKLLSQPVGAAARKAAKKPSKVVITKVAA